MLQYIFEHQDDTSVSTDNMCRNIDWHAFTWTWNTCQPTNKTPTLSKHIFKISYLKLLAWLQKVLVIVVRKFDRNIRELERWFLLKYSDWFKNTYKWSLKISLILNYLFELMRYLRHNAFRYIVKFLNISEDCSKIFGGKN